MEIVILKFNLSSILLGSWLSNFKLWRVTSKWLVSLILVAVNFNVPTAIFVSFYRISCEYSWVFNQWIIFLLVAQLLEHFRRETSHTETTVEYSELGYELYIDLENYLKSMDFHSSVLSKNKESFRKYSYFSTQPSSIFQNFWKYPKSVSFVQSTLESKNTGSLTK